ncbi:MAG: FAD-dependent oxidoreductase [Turicibacter sp.]|nr:FAD-dependent oxidoreductase [Turicibacter sp.]
MGKILLIGANHAGTAAANTILDNYKDKELVIFDRNNNISYLGCGTALYIGKQIAGTDGLFYSSKEELEKKGATVYMNTTVTDIDYDNKVVKAKQEDGTVIEETYEKLILATGSSPLRPSIKGTEADDVFFVKLFQDSQKINERLNDPDVQNVITVGAGYIGVEIAEAVHRRGKNSMLFDLAEGVLSGYYDKEFSQEMSNVLEKGGVKLHFKENLEKINSLDGTKVTSVVSNKGEYPADLVLLAVGFRPNTDLGQGRVELGTRGAFKVNLKQQTSVKDVYAIGDCATVYNNALGDEDYIALATNAVRSGIIAAHNVCGKYLNSAGVQGSNGICIFDYKMFSTGLSLERAQARGIPADYVDYEDNQKPEFMESNNGPVKLRVIYAKKTRKIIGAQIASYLDISMGLHLFSLAISKGLTINELPLLDIFFMPHFNKPFNYITMAGLTAR